MRSVAALAALALTGAFNLAAASRCKPSSVTSATSLDTTTASSLDTSMTSLDTTATETSTGTAGESTETAAPGSVIKNIVTNGGFSKKDPGGDPSKIPGFTVTGDGTLVTGGGYTGDGSSDKNAVQLSVSSTPPGKRKRQTARGETAGFGQFLDNLDTRTQYTVQFFYYIVTAPAQRTMCVLQAGLGNGIFFNTFIYSTGQATFYERIVVQTSAPSVGADIFIHSSCQDGGLSTIFVDSLFMSNQVTPGTIDNYSLDFGGGDVHTPPLDPVTTSNPEGSSTQEPSETSTFPSNGDQSTSFSLQPTKLQSTTDSGRTSSFVTVTSETAVTSTEAPSTVTESLPECTLAESDGCSYIGGGTGCFRYGRQVDTFFLAGDHSSWHCEALCGEMPDRCKSSAWDNDANMCRFSSRSINDPDFGSGSGPELSWNDQACFKCFCHDADLDRYFRTVSEHDGQTDAPTTTSGATNTAVETTTEATATSNADSGETTTPAETTTTTTTTTTLDFNIDETTTSAAFEETTTTLLSEDTTTSGNGASNGPNTEPTTTKPGSSSQTNTCSTKDAVQNGGFESDLASDGWAFKGQAGVTNNGDLGQTRTGGKAAFLRWPSVNTKAGFSQNIGGLEIGKPYTLSYWHHTAEGKKLDLDECDILVRFDNRNFDNFDPFYDNRAPNGYVNRYNTVYPTSTVAPLSFELSCNGNNPDPFVIMMDDISLIPTCGRQNQQEED
ncbi:hypothetical protein FDECE_1131 [Fusarium decemcellulare]|nr:hypothetical protein FDECE_1131 [Fusarium decemcellulare]